MLPKTGRTRRRIDEYLDDYEDEVRVSMELESSEMQKHFTEADLGVTFMAVTSAREEIHRKDKALSLASLGLIRLVSDFAAHTGLGLPSVTKAS